MKKNIYLLLVGLFSGQLTVLAQEPKKKVVNIEIQSDTTIIVRDLFNGNCKLYGDKIVAEEDMTKIRSSENGARKDTIHYSTYGGKNGLFEQKIEKLNKDNKKYIIKEDDGDISIFFKYKDLPDNTFEISFCGVTYDGVLTLKENSKGISYWGSNWWCQDKNSIYSIYVTKKNDVETSQIVESNIEPQAKDFYHKSEKDNDVEPVLEGNNANDTGLQIGSQNEMLGVALIIFIIICLIIAIFIRINRLNKRIDNCEANKSSCKSDNIDTIKQTIKSKVDSTDLVQMVSNDDIDKIKRIVISKINSTDLIQRISNDDIYNLINRSDIQLYIQNVIAGKVEEYLGNKVNVPTQPIVETPVQSTNIAQPALRTTKIEYQPTNNGFVISEDSPNKIFEMYSSNGEYYYTIVNDSTIKNEMLGFIAAFANYVETRQDSSNPSTVEVIRDGHLIKNGDMYIVDVNCLLQISLR